ncbi:MAG: Uma2 family endonuclease [Oscillospiraceae bacterium]|jgi:Uma2 family endonuclease|nr:Uma2 family endonuclease [Oscillospiraceae bacterium]
MEMTLARRTDERYTYADFCTWDDDKRWELIDGIAYALASPLLAHQSVSSRLLGQLFAFLRDKPCKVFAAPLSVRLNADSADDTVLQPDIVVVCDRSKLDKKGIVGAPDMVIEILSPSTARRDKFEKLRIYENAGVREYWIVDPDSKTAQVHILRDGVFDFNIYGDTAPVHVLDGCRIALDDVFADVEISEE